MSDNVPVANVSIGHIDYREAFVIDMEMAAHGPNCNTCIEAALSHDHDKFCDRMKFMHSYIKRAFEALPTYYKDRYAKANLLAMSTGG